MFTDVEQFTSEGMDCDAPESMSNIYHQPALDMSPSQLTLENILSRSNVQIKT